MTDIILCFIVWDIGVCLVPPNLLGSFGACLCRGCVVHANKLLLFLVAMKKNSGEL